MAKKIKQQEENWVELGNVAVDSGQLMICDPCYLHDWDKDDEYKDIRLFKDKVSGKLFAYNTPHARSAQMVPTPEFFDSFESKLSTGKTPNECYKNQEWEDVEYPHPEKFGYNWISQNNNPAIQVKKGLALAFRSGYGDGYYPVLGRLDENGRIVEVRIDMDDIFEGLAP